MPDRLPLSAQEQRLLSLRDAGRVNYDLYRNAHKGLKAISLALICVACFIFGVLLLKPEPAVQAFIATPGVHLLSLVEIGALALVQYLFVPARRDHPLARKLVLLVLLLTTLRLVEIGLGEATLGLSAGLDRMIGIPSDAAGARTGANTAVCGGLIALSHLLRRRAPGLAMGAATLAPMIPLVALVGYSFRLERFYGEMSLWTALMLLPLGAGALVNFGHLRVLRTAFADTTVGVLTRVQLILAHVIPWATGILFYIAREFVGPGLQAVLITLIIWGVTLMVILTSNAHERTDKLRRRTERRLVVLSMRDPLTGAVNRQGLFLGLHQMPRVPTGVFIVDLDDFKLVNDRHGHLAGDRVLRAVGLALRARMRSGDVVARWGGEEFLVLAPGVGAEALAPLADELRRIVGALRDPVAGQVTASVGATLMAADESGLDRAVARADIGLYKAKALGRNRAVVNLEDPRQKPMPKVAVTMKTPVAGVVSPTGDQLA